MSKNTTSTEFLLLGQQSVSDFSDSLNKKPIDYKKETIFYFYNSMLNYIVEKQEPNIEDSTESICSAEVVLTSKPYKPCLTIVEEEESKLHNISSKGRMSKFNLSFTKRKSISRLHNANMTSSIVDIYKKSSKPRPNRSMAKFAKKAKLRSSSFKRLFYNKKEEVEQPPKDAWIVKTDYEDSEITFANGNKYIGEMYQKVMHGYGKFIWWDGTIYTGEFKDGEMTGKGRIEYSDKSTYEGIFYKGYRHGYGCRFPETQDAFYSGQYYLGKKHGEGRIVFGPNNYYEGTFNMNIREGTGLRHYPNGATYRGDLHNGLRHGFGTIILQNNDFYDGEWKNGKKHGYGEYVWDAFLNNRLCIPVQNKYCGMWDDDFIHGFGLLYFGNEGGARYAGIFHKNIKHGPGIVVCNNGAVIKSDPLFVNDKAVRIAIGTVKDPYTTEKSSTFVDSATSTTDLRSINSCNTVTCSNLEPRIFPILSHHKLESSNLSSINNFVFPCFGYEKSTLANINFSCLMYPRNFNIEYVPIHIRLSSMEQVDVTDLINKVAAKYLIEMNNTNNKENMNNIKNRYFQQSNMWPTLLSEHFCEDYVFDRFNKYKITQNFFIMEEMCIRKAIRKNLGYLRELYDYYAFVACIQERPNYKPWMMRICFWQLLMDCRLHYKNISLVRVDEMMAEYTLVNPADIHNPFDVVHFWDFLTCLLNLAWKLYENDFMIIKTNGLLEKMFNKFLEKDVFPNARRHIGTALFDYKDVIPIKAAYEWFKSLGPNFTVYNFLKSACTLNKTFPIGFGQNTGMRIPHIQNGQNIAFVSDKIIFRKTYSYYVGGKKIFYPEVRAFKHGLYLKPLKFLFLLSGRKVLAILKDICPMVVIQNEYIDMNHVMSFWEFYEAVLRCTQEKVVQDEQLLTNISRCRSTINATTKLKGRKPNKKTARTKTCFAK